MLASRLKCWGTKAHFFQKKKKLTMLIPSQIVDDCQNERKEVLAETDNPVASCCTRSISSGFNDTNCGKKRVTFTKWSLTVDTEFSFPAVARWFGVGLAWNRIYSVTNQWVYTTNYKSYILKKYSQKVPESSAGSRRRLEIWTVLSWAGIDDCAGRSSERDRYYLSYRQPILVSE